MTDDIYTIQQMRCMTRNLPALIENRYPGLAQLMNFMKAKELIFP